MTEQKSIPTPQQVIDTITKRPTYTDLVPHLERMYGSAKDRQTKAGVQFDLTFEEFLELITPARRRMMQVELNKRRLKRFMDSNRGYVLTPKGRKELADKLCNKDTYEFVNREKSRRNQHLKKGDTHREISKAKIAESRRGTTQTDETREKIRKGNLGQTRSAETCMAISAGNKGKSKTPEQIEKMKEAAKARWAAVRAAKETEAAKAGEQKCPENTQSKRREKSQMPAEANHTPMMSNAASVMLSEAKSYPQSIVQQLQRVSAIVGQKSTTRPFNTGLSAQA